MPTVCVCVCERESEREREREGEGERERVRGRERESERERERQTETYSNILKVLHLMRKTQTRLHTEIAHASNATMSLRAFICVRFACRRLRLFAIDCMRIRIYSIRQKKLPCTVRFTLDRLMKTEVKLLLNGL